MSVSITVVRPDSREPQVVETATTGLDIFGADRTVVAMRVNGELRDLARELAASASHWQRFLLDDDPQLISTGTTSYRLNHTRQRQ